MVSKAIIWQSKEGELALNQIIEARVVDLGCILAVFDCIFSVCNCLIFFILIQAIYLQISYIIFTKCGSMPLFFLSVWNMLRGLEKLKEGKKKKNLIKFTFKVE